MAKREPAIFDEPDLRTENAADADGVADLDAGRVILHETMKAWLESWGKPDESPPPRSDD